MADKAPDISRFDTSQDDATISTDTEYIFIYRMSNKTKIDISSEKELSESKDQSLRVEPKDLGELHYCTMDHIYGKKVATAMLTWN